MIIDFIFGLLTLTIILFTVFVATLLLIQACTILVMSSIEFDQQPKGLLSVIKGKGLVFNLKTRKIERL